MAKQGQTVSAGGAAPTGYRENRLCGCVSMSIICSYAQNDLQTESDPLPTTAVQLRGAKLWRSTQTKITQKKPNKSLAITSATNSGSYPTA